MVTISHNVSVNRKVWAAIIERKDRFNALRDGGPYPDLSVGQVVELLAKHGQVDPDAVRKFDPVTRRPGRPRVRRYS